MENFAEPPVYLSQKFIFPATSSDVRAALKNLQNALKPLALPIEEAGAIELVLAEVLNNIIEHAYKSEAGGKVELTVTQRCDGFLFETLDDGIEMPDGQAPLGERMLLEEDFNAIPEGGFGWFLIRDLAHDVSYTRHEAKNHLKFRMAVCIPAFSGA